MRYILTDMLFEFYILFQLFYSITLKKLHINQAKLFHLATFYIFYGEKKIEVYADRAYKAKWLCIQYPFSLNKFTRECDAGENFHILKQI